jgi:uncharacterized protein
VNRDPSAEAQNARESLPLDPNVGPEIPLQASSYTNTPDVPLARARYPVWSGWDVLLIAGLTIVSAPVVGVFLAIGARLARPHSAMDEILPLLMIAAQLITYVAVAFFMVLLIEGKYRVHFWQAIRWNWPVWPIKMFALGVVLLLSINFLARFLPMPKSTPFDQFFANPRDAMIMSVFAVTLGPLMEELFFRGLLYPVLERWLGVFWGIVLTALPFGLIHMFQYGYAWGVVLLIFLMGVVCTIVRWKTNSVASSFLVHVGYNATEMFLLVLVTQGFRHMEKAMVIAPW